MKTDFLRAFLMTVDTGSMAEASRRLNITAAAVAAPATGGTGVAAATTGGAAAEVADAEAAVTADGAGLGVALAAVAEAVVDGQVGVQGKQPGQALGALRRQTEALAGQLAMSPFHFHRLFKSVTGMTPKAWQQAWRAQRLREALEQGIPVTRAALAAGFPDSSSYYRQADAALGMTASQFRRGGAATVVTWTTGDCALGRCLVAQSERGVCAVLPGDNDAALLDDLRQRFPRAELRQGDPEFRRQMAEIFAHLDDSRRPVSLPLDLRGTAFQLQVWQALRQIPAGETRSYRQVAQSIGRPRAVRAVASACAANKLALVIPCHRVVHQDGSTTASFDAIERHTQQRLLEAEGVLFSSDHKVIMSQFQWRPEIS